MRTFLFLLVTLGFICLSGVFVNCQTEPVGVCKDPRGCEPESGGSTSGSSNPGPSIWDTMRANREAAAREKRVKDGLAANDRGIAAWNNADLETAVKEFTLAHEKLPDSVNIKNNLDRAIKALAEQRNNEAKWAAESAERSKRAGAVAASMASSMQNAADSISASTASNSLEFGDPSVKPSSANTDTSVVDLRGINESKYFYALQTRTLTPMGDGGNPIDPESKPVGRNGLVGGTQWTYGFKWPSGACDEKCHSEIKAELDSQLKLRCSSEKDPAACITKGLPFTPDNYQMVVSMASFHSALEDLATRVVFDNATLGEFTKTNKEVFASLEGREFDTLDCHSNGAMLCLAALRGKLTTAKTVRLFGPQITPEAAEVWRQLANDPTNPIKLEIYINNGDPVPAASWKLPKIAPVPAESVTEAWTRNATTFIKGVPGIALNVVLDSQTNVMDKELATFGFKVNRLPCSKLPTLDCHSMSLYEGRAK